MFVLIAAVVQDNFMNEVIKAPGCDCNGFRLYGRNMIVLNSQGLLIDPAHNWYCQFHFTLAVPEELLHWMIL